MKKKYFYIVILILICVWLTLIGKSFSKEVPSISQNDIDLTLDITDDLEEKIMEHIDIIDNSLIPLTSYNQSTVLSNNYEFLTDFAISFILNNIDYYKDEIFIMDDYVYNDGYNTYVTNQYVNIDVIYDITKSVFNKRDFVILNKRLSVNNNMVPLLLIDDNDFSMSIERVVDINENNGDYEVKIKYQYLDIIYKYEYVKTMNNTLVLNNLEIETGNL